MAMVFMIGDGHKLINGDQWRCVDYHGGSTFGDVVSLYFLSFGNRRASDYNARTHTTQKKQSPAVHLTLHNDAIYR